jgi:hypothetical protein
MFHLFQKTLDHTAVFQDDGLGVGCFVEQPVVVFSLVSIIMPDPFEKIKVKPFRTPFPISGRTVP